MTPEQEQRMQDAYEGPSHGTSYAEHCRIFKAGVAAQALGPPVITTGGDTKHEPTIMWGCSCGAAFHDSDDLWRHLDAYGALPALFKPALA